MHAVCSFAPVLCIFSPLKLFLQNAQLNVVHSCIFDFLRVHGPGLVDGPCRATDRGFSRGQWLGPTHREPAPSLLAERSLPARFVTRILTRIMPAFSPHLVNAGLNGSNRMHSWEVAS